MLGLSIPSVAYRNPASLAARVADLFRNGEQAVWFDPSDISTLYQDAAGTTPVTAMEQPVGKMLDKSGRGNHCTFKAGTGRPVLSARYNLLTYTEDFSDSAWVKARTTVLSNVAVAPDGSLTADKLVEDTSSNTTHLLTQIFLPSVGLYTFSIYMKAAERTHAALYTWASGGNTAILTINLTNGNVVANAGPFVNVTVVHLGSGWFNVKAQLAPNSTARREFQLRTADETGNHVYTGDGTSGIYIWGADVRPTNDGIGLPSYQRVVDSATYDTAGFPAYLRADGTDDSGSTNSIDFSGTDKITVFAGVRKLSDASAAMVAELSSDWWANNGTFALSAPQSAGQNTYNFLSKGTVAQSRTFSAFPSPITNTVTGVGDISRPGVGGSVNGVHFEQVTSTQGTGSFGNYPLFLFARNNASIYFNGRLYGLIVLGRAATATEIANTERYLNQKGRLYA